MDRDGGDSGRGGGGSYDVVVVDGTPTSMMSRSGRLTPRSGARGSPRALKGWS
jgi:hypothetical protein